MSTATPAVRELARRLLAYEAARARAPDGGVEAAGRVLEALRVRLSKLMGVVGFSTLLSRAVALAKAEAPSLESVEVRADGTLEGLGPAAGREEGAGTRAVRDAVLIAHLLELLVTFIGAPLTVRLLRDAFPEAPAEAVDLRNEEKR